MNHAEARALGLASAWVAGSLLMASILPVGQAGAGSPFKSMDVKGKGLDVLFCDLDGDRLLDIVLVDGLTLSVFYQDLHSGFTEDPGLQFGLDNRPSLIWTARIGRQAESLFVMTHAGVEELDLACRTGAPQRRQIIGQQTILPETADGPSVRPFRLSGDTTPEQPLLLVPVGDGLQIWTNGENWHCVQSLGHVADTSIWPSIANPGYTQSVALEMGLGDVNGDGRDDLIVNRRLLDRQTYNLYARRNDGLFATEPVLSYDDSSDWRSWLCWVDINRDGHPDLIKNTWLYEPWFIPGTRSGKVLVRLYVADEQGRIPPQPQQVFRKNDWMPSIPIVDVDGDGLLDLVLGYSLFDSREGIRKTMTAKQLDYNLQFHFYRPGVGFPAKADCQRDLLIRLDQYSLYLTSSRRRHLEHWVNLDGDFDGDGHKDLLVRDHGDSVSSYRFVSRRAGFGKKAVARFPYREPLEGFDVRDLNQDGTSDLIMRFRGGGLRVFLSHVR